MIRRLFGVGFIIIVILAGVAYYLSTIVQPPPSPAAITPEAQKQALDRLNDDVKNPEPVDAPDTATPSTSSAPSATSVPGHATATPTPTPALKGNIKVHFSESDVNTMIQTNKDVQAKMSRVGATAATLHFFPPNTVDVSAWINVNGMQRQITVSGLLEPDGNGGLAYHTNASEVGELPLPAGVTADRLDSEAGKILEMVEPVLPLSVKIVSVDGTNLILSGPSKPAKVGN